MINDIPDEVEYHPVGGVNEEQETQRQAERQARAGRQDPADRWRSSSVSRDLWKISGDRAFVTIYHHRARKTLFVPSGIGFTIPADEFRNERYTACVQVGTGRMVAFSDNWRERGEADPEIGYWTGRTILVFQGNELPWEVYPPGGDDDEEVRRRKQPLPQCTSPRLPRRVVERSPGADPEAGEVAEEMEEHGRPRSTLIC